MKLSLALSACALVLLSAAPLSAIVANGETFFSVVPKLTRAMTTNVSASYNTATYTFDVAVPSDSGEPLGGLIVGIPRRVRVPDPGQIRVLSGGTSVPLQVESLSGQRLRLNLQKPVSPGQAVTIELSTMRNPRGGGTYLFEINAQPAGTNPFTYFLGFGRLEFFAGGSGSS
ncbi:DUF2808 domain-containing protein [Gloeobacter violaceus]|uniref:Gll1314 protein n=1 Tax=Gloeobacter violaceus (strain ATCC 29082 / PCC 7421) TaxID=251221 RepID=Q7NL12_GLOVI|nr:DUF2808 domain-containing protein [Gloeobacter violaceus]BAC89255.1 gll1314 [Gloeobacter violaceus PCC 7421]